MQREQETMSEFGTRSDRINQCFFIFNIKFHGNKKSYRMSHDVGKVSGRIWQFPLKSKGPNADDGKINNKTVYEVIVMVCFGSIPRFS